MRISKFGNFRRRLIASWQWLRYCVLWDASIKARTMINLHKNDETHTGSIVKTIDDGNCKFIKGSPGAYIAHIYHVQNMAATKGIRRGLEGLFASGHHHGSVKFQIVPIFQLGFTIRINSNGQGYT